MPPVSSLNRDGSEIADDLRWGVYVTLKAGNKYVADCFEQYGVKTDATGKYAAMYRPSHLIGLELGFSVASAALRHEPTGTSQYFIGDVGATAKKDLEPGERLDGEGGYTVFGKLIQARESLAKGVLPRELPLKNVFQKVRWLHITISKYRRKIPPGHCEKKWNVPLPVRLWHDL